MSSENTILVKRLNEYAIIPKRAHNTDAGFDVWVIDRKENGILPKRFQWGNTCINIPQIQYYGTGLAIKPPDGYYFELVARSSLHKKGFMLANNIGIIDSDYRGEIIFALYNIYPENTTFSGTPALQKFIESNQLKLPCKIGQLIPRKIELPNVVSFTEVDELSDTERGTGGFGSTDVEKFEVKGVEKGVREQRDFSCIENENFRGLLLELYVFCKTNDIYPIDTSDKEFENKYRGLTINIGSHAFFTNEQVKRIELVFSKMDISFFYSKEENENSSSEEEEDEREIFSDEAEKTKLFSWIMSNLLIIFDKGYNSWTEIWVDLHDYDEYIDIYF